GYAMADHYKTPLITKAIEMAARNLDLPEGAIAHSDRGSNGGFNWSSQHLDHGGVQGWRRATGERRPAVRRRRFVGSGVLIGR
ncbi:MAG: hypothetical protein WAT47_10030, partial [Nostocoides sp.]